MAVLSVVGITLVGYRGLHLNQTTMALAFLLGVLGISASWGLREAVFMSVIATLAFNYYFLPPIGTFTIADPQNWMRFSRFSSPQSPPANCRRAHGRGASRHRAAAGIGAPLRFQPVAAFKRQTPPSC